MASVSRFMGEIFLVRNRMDLKMMFVVVLAAVNSDYMPDIGAVFLRLTG